MKKVFLAFLLISTSQIIFGQEQPTKRTSELKEGEALLILTDGSRVKGVINVTELQLKTAYGDLKIPVKEIKQIKFPDAKKEEGAEQPLTEVEVQTVKFTPVGSLQIEKFEIKTAGGTLTVNKADIEKIVFWKGLQDEFTNSIGMKFVLISAGEFLMGSLKNEQEGRSDEMQHKVKITKPFYLQTTEVTQAQWKSIMGNSPSYFKGDNLPVEQVSWEDAQEFIKKLSAKEGVNYRLPTEAEWEYACRAGSTTKYCFGDDESKLGEYAWYDKNSDDKTHPVGKKKPNAWGLYDMHGNVWEWCQDRYDGDYYKNSPAEDPQGPATDESRVHRGGCWGSSGDTSHSARRGHTAGPVNDDYYDSVIGFRLARSSE